MMRRMVLQSSLHQRTSMLVLALERPPCFARYDLYAFSMGYFSVPKNNLRQYTNARRQQVNW
jgi:hypothetical protein